MIRAVFRLSGTAQFGILVGVVVIAVIVLFLVSGGIDLGGGDDDDPLAIEQLDDQVEGDASDASSGQDTSPSATQTEDQPFQFGDLRVVVTELQLSTIVSEGRDTVEAIEQFASVLLTVRNTGTRPVSLAGALLLIDEGGRTFTPNVMATAAVALRDDSRFDALSFELQPSIATNLVVVFDVPEEVLGLRLRLLGGYVDVDLDLDG